MHLLDRKTPDLELDKAVGRDVDSDKAVSQFKVKYAVYGAALLGIFYHLAVLVHIENVNLLTMLGLSFVGFIFFPI
jgi:hypothetical protein